jgi:hypothetical protein
VGERPYSAPMPPAEALAELRRCAGSQFDPEVVEAFCADGGGPADEGVAGAWFKPQGDRADAL